MRKDKKNLERKGRKKIMLVYKVNKIDYNNNNNNSSSSSQRPTGMSIFN